MENDYIISFRIDNEDVKNGDIVLVLLTDELISQKLLSGFRSGSRNYLCKRVIALEGDEISMISGKLILNGKEVYFEEQLSDNFTFQTHVVGENQAYLMGDNRGKSYDSRMFSNVTLDQIQFRVVCRVRFFENSLISLKRYR